MLFFGNYLTSSRNPLHTLPLKDYWWIFAIVAVILIIFLDKAIWRRGDNMKIPTEGRLIRLKKELNQDNHSESEEDYKL